MTAVGFITFISVISRFKVTWLTYKKGYNYPYIARKKGINTYTRTTGCLN